MKNINIFTSRAPSFILRQQSLKMILIKWFKKCNLKRISQNHTLSFSLRATGLLIGSSEASCVPRIPLVMDTVVVELEMAVDLCFAHSDLHKLLCFASSWRFFNFLKSTLWAKSKLIAGYMKPFHYFAKIFLPQNLILEMFQQNPLEKDIYTTQI